LVTVHCGTCWSSPRALLLRLRPWSLPPPCSRLTWCMSGSTALHRRWRRSTAAPTACCPGRPSFLPSSSATSRTPSLSTGSNHIWDLLLCSQPSRHAVASRLLRATSAATPPSSLGGGRVEAPVVMRRRFLINPPKLFDMAKCASPVYVSTVNTRALNKNN